MDKKSKTRENKNKLRLDNIVDLGGNKDDLQLLAGIGDNSDSDIEDHDNDFDAEPVRKDEIKQFLKELDIFKYRPKDMNMKEEKEKKKKQKSEKNTEQDKTEKVENTSDPQPSTSAQADETGSTKKKKKKNKFKIQHDEVSSTTVDPSSELLSHMKSYQTRKYLLVKAGGEALDNQKSSVGERLTDTVVQQMEDFAAKLLRDEIAVYNKQKENTKKSDVGWMKTVLASGTLADKMAALTVLVQESPLHGLQHIDTLIGMAKKKGKRECIMATDTLKDLFLTNITPDDRKLRYFNQRPLSSVGETAGWNKDVIDRKLLMWYYESQLKHKYADFVKALEVMAHDTLPATKQKTVSTVYQLLVKKPEQEKALLTMLINKVGDPDYKLASKVSHYLTTLVEEHPNMKSVVVKEVEMLLFRPNIPQRAQYYSVCFLNQLSLSHTEKELAGQLIKIYFAFFKAYVKKAEVDSKMMSALLSGVNRAFPYAKLDVEFLSNEMENLYKIVHLVNFNTSIQALMLLYQVMDTSENISERFYIALYKKLSDPALKTSSKQAMFLNLVFKSMNKDISERRIKAFVKRLLQVCCYQQPQFTCGALILLSEVLKDRPGLITLSHVEEDSDEEEHFVDLPNPDSDTENVDQDDDDDDKDNNQIGNKEEKSRQKSGLSWYHRANLNHKSASSDYDPYHRNPQFCHAENSCIWELEMLAEHFHPTVSLFAKQILKGESLSYSGDPLQDFTLIRFLDRFVYKNPKKVEQVKEKVSTISCHQSKPSGIKSIPVNSEQFVKLEETRVPVDDRFFHRYFTQKAAREKKEGQLSDEDSEAESVGDDEFDEYLDKYEEHLDDGDFGDLDLDFAEEFGKKKGKKKGGSDSDMSDDDFGDDNDDDNLDEEDDDAVGANVDDNLSDEEVEFSDDGDFLSQFKDADDFDIDDEEEEEEEGVGGSGAEAGATQGFNEEDVEFSDDDEFQELAPKSKKVTKRKAKESSDAMLPVKKGKKSSPGLLSAAEEFAHMMDENVGSKLDSTGAEALANKDKADVKQLKWEADRDRWLHGKNDWRSKKGGKSARKQGHFSNKGRQFSGKGKHKGKRRK